MHDIAIIGGGPAGMTAALYALRNGKSAVVLERTGFGGQMTYSPKLENYPGTLQASGNELADSMLDQIMKQGADVELENAVAVEAAPSGLKAVVTEEGTRHECKAVVIATGVKHRMLGLEGEDALVGDGISFCAVCDGDFYTGKRVCIAGGGNSALQEAILLAGKCSEVVILQDLPQLTGEGRLQENLLARPNVKVLTGVKITGYDAPDGRMRGVFIEKADGEKTAVACDGLFLAIGLIPENKPFEAVAELDGRGYFASGEDCATKTPGVFVAGDCRAKTTRQITTAVADGAVAALAACRYIDGAFAGR